MKLLIRHERLARSFHVNKMSSSNCAVVVVGEVTQLSVSMRAAEDAQQMFSGQPYAPVCWIEAHSTPVSQSAHS